MEYIFITIGVAIVVLLIIGKIANKQLEKIAVQKSNLEKKAEEKLDRIKRIEELTSEKIHTMSYAEQISQYISDGIVIIENEKIVYTNSAFENILQYNKNELIGTNWFDFLDEKDKKKAEVAIRCNFQNATKIGNALHYLLRWKKKDNTAATLWCTIAPIKEKVYYGICRDVSCENGKEEKVFELIDELINTEINNGHIKNEKVVFIHKKQTKWSLASNE